jgi:UDP-N-acetylmuramate--alanine ligase
MNILDFNSFYLVGIKGVAITSMAQLLIDAGKTVTGCDFEEDFVTQDILDKLAIKIDIGFDHQLPENIDCVIFTAAHSSIFNPMVVQAQQKGIAVFSHAQALADFFNQKKGIAISGVGGKSTVSAMIAWIFEKTNHKASYSVGVGNIPGLEKTAQWDKDSEYFIAEADEYVTDPSAIQRGEPITPRFSFLQPYITVCTNLKFDHPDVYEDFEQTKEIFFQFFNQISPEGKLIINFNDLVHQPTTSAQSIITFGKDSQASFAYTFLPEEQKPGLTIAQMNYQNQQFSLNLKIPGEYNIKNALSALAVTTACKIDLASAISVLSDFSSTKRRFESIGVKNNITYYDDYAHHPNEILSAISALNVWYPNQKKIIIFQPHTYSRTKQLLHEFVHSFKNAQEVYFLDIFASARESLDESISSDDIVKGINQNYPEIKTHNLHDINQLADYLKKQIEPNSVILTLGAGDIYKVHDLIN